MDALFFIGAKIIKTIKRHGYEAYFVGGAVRDFLLKRPIHDIDITTSASVEELKEIFETTVPVGIKHGTIIVRVDNCSVEVTTFRSEKTTPLSLMDDLQKRDFTINAMAMTETKEIIDPLHFRNDLNRQIIRAVGNAEDRFREDPLRMLRACRFSGQLDFQIEPTTLQSMIACRDQIKKVAIERIVTELEKLWTSTYYHQGLQYLLKANIAKYISIFVNKEKTLAQFATLQLGYLRSIEEIWTAFLAVNQQNEDLENDLKLLKKSKLFVREVVQLYKGLQTFQSNGWTNDLLYELGLEQSLKLHRLVAVLLPEHSLDDEMEIEKKYNNLPIKNRQELAINGQILLQTFQCKQGPWIEKKLLQAEKAVLACKIRNKPLEIINWLRKERGSDEGEAVGDVVTE